MKKVFIAQPMYGIPEDEIKFNRACATQKVMRLFGDDIIFVNALVEQDAPDGVDPGLWYLGHSILAMSEADAVCFCRGWRDCRGCVIEYNCADAYGLDIYEI